MQLDALVGRRDISQGPLVLVLSTCRLLSLALRVQLQELISYYPPPNVHCNFFAMFCSVNQPTQSRERFLNFTKLANSTFIGLESAFSYAILRII